MSIKFYCVNCNKKLKVEDSSAGKKAQCPKCRSFTRIPGTRISKKRKKRRSAFEDDSVDRVLGGGQAKAPLASRAPKQKGEKYESLRPGVSISKVETPVIPAALPTAIPVAGLSGSDTAVVDAPPPSASSASTSGYKLSPAQSELPTSMLPQAEPVSHELPQALPPSPYESPQPIPDPQGQVYAGGGRGALMRVFAPLHNNGFYLKAAGWWMILYGVLLGISIVGLVICWLPIWLGICMKNAANEIDAGFATGDVRRFESANRNLSTYFVIIGILSILGLILSAIGLAIMVLSFMIGGVSAFSAM